MATLNGVNGSHPIPPVHPPSARPGHLYDNRLDFFEMHDGSTQLPRSLARLASTAIIEPFRPLKRINDGNDLHFFCTSKAYADIVTFIRQLNWAMVPRLPREPTERFTDPIDWPLDDSQITYSPQVLKFKDLVQSLQAMLEEAPCEPGQHRFGNPAYRRWHALLRMRIRDFLQQALPDNVWTHVDSGHQGDLRDELAAYLLGSFGSPERLDYGTGHELSFLAFLAAVWKLNGFAPSDDGSEERGIVIEIIDKYVSQTLTCQS